MNKIAFMRRTFQETRADRQAVMELMENIDEVISANSRFENIARS
ncbi:MAG: hypothetical protein ACLT4D_07935 [Blautia faecis]